MRNPAFYVGKPVTSLQTMLRVIASQDDLIPSIVPDGIYGAQTMRAVTALQREYHLPPTGITDLDTWTAVCEAYNKAQIEAEPAEPLQIHLSPNQTITEGSKSPYVILIQTLLHTIDEQYDNLPDCIVNGVYDQMTMSAVKALQRVSGLPETGCLDKQLWRLLAGLYAQSVGDGDYRIKTRCNSDEEADSPKNERAPLPPHGEETLYCLK